MGELSDWSSRLKQRVKIEQLVKTADELGGFAISWTELATVWADVRPILGTAREGSQAGQAKAVAGYRVRMRKRDGLKANARLVWNDRTLLIHSLHEQDGIFELLTYEEGL